MRDETSHNLCLKGDNIELDRPQKRKRDDLNVDLNDWSYAAEDRDMWKEGDSGTP